MRETTPVQPAPGLGGVTQYLEAASQRLLEIDSRIDAQPDARVYEAKLADRMREIVDELVATRRATLASLQAECAELEAQIHEAGRLLDQDAALDARLATMPLRPRRQRLAEIFERVERLVAEREKQVRECRRTISVCCSELCIPEPRLSELLTVAAVDEARALAADLRERREATRRQFAALLDAIDAMYDYLGEPHEQSVRSLSADALDALQEAKVTLEKRYNARKQEVDGLQDALTNAMSILDLPPDYSFECDRTVPGGSAPGSDANLELLRMRADEMRQLRRAKLGQFIASTHERLALLYDSMYYDLGRRLRPEAPLPENEESLQRLEAELARLNQLQLDPERRAVTALLEKYEQVLSNERELEEMKQDTKRLARGGFAATLNREQRLLRFNAECTASTIAALQPLVRAYRERHGESFAFHGQPVEQLIESKLKNVARRASGKRLAAPPGPQKRQLVRGAVSAGDLGARTRPPRPATSSVRAPRTQDSQASRARAQARAAPAAPPVIRLPRSRAQLPAQPAAASTAPSSQKSRRATHNSATAGGGRADTGAHALADQPPPSSSSSPAPSRAPLSEVGQNQPASVEMPEWARKRHAQLREMDVSYFDGRSPSFEYSRDAF